MTTFQERARQGELFAVAVHDLLKGDAFIRCVTRAGIERGDLADVLDDIRRSANPMERRLRFNPDGSVLVHRLAHWEAKASLFIEKDPYDFYMEYENRGEPVVLFISPGLLKNHEISVAAPLYCGRVKHLVLRHGSEYENQFEKPRPVDHDGWIRPRADQYGPRYAKNGPTGSGTPFRPIDIKQSRMVKLSHVRFTRSSGTDQCEIDRDLFAGDGMGRLL
jgi:hypothetical protein